MKNITKALKTLLFEKDNESSFGTTPKKNSTTITSR